MTRRYRAAVLILAMAGPGCRCSDTADSTSGAGVDAARPPEPRPAPTLEDRSKAARLVRALKKGNLRLTALPPGDPGQIRNLERGKSMLQAGDKESAAAHFTAAAQGAVTGSKVSALLALGDLYREMGRLPDCVDVHEKAAAVAPGVPEVLLQLGRAYRAAGRLGDAEKSLRQAVKLEPRLLPAWRDLGVLAAEDGRDADAAKALLTYEKYLFDVVRRLQEGGEDDRLIAVDALALTRDEKAIEALVAALDDPAAAVRAAGAEALGDTASIDALGALRAHLETEAAPEVRTALKQAIGRLEPLAPATP